MVALTQFILVVVVSEPTKIRSSTVKCFIYFEDGDQFFKLLIELPSKILAFPRILEEKYYTSSQVAKISDCYFINLKYIMDTVGVSGFLTQRSRGFGNLISLSTGMLVFWLLAYYRPDFTLLTRLFFISNPQMYSAIIALNACLAWELVKKSIDFSATSLNVLCGIWSPDFFSRNQAWVINERIFMDAKFAAKVTIIAALESSNEAQRHLKAHKKLLKPLENYFNPSEVESMNLLPGEFSHADMLLLSDRLTEFDEFSVLKGSVSIQTILFLLVCKELNFSFNETISTESSTTNKIEGETKTAKNTNNKFRCCKQMFRILVYRSPTLRPLTRLSRLLVSSCRCVKFAKTSNENRIVKQKKRNISYLEQCLQSKTIN